MTTYLVTGITGQAGSYLADILLAQPTIRVVGVRRRSSTNTSERISHHLDNPRLEIVEGDITDYNSVYNIIGKYQPEYLLNTAAQSQVGTSFHEPQHTMAATGQSVYNILESLRLLSPTTRFVQFSSSEMFGSNYNDGPGLGDFRWQDESTPFAPNSPYGIAKLAGYHYTRLYREAYGMFAANAIMFNYESPRRGEYFVTQKIAKYVRELNEWLQDFPASATTPDVDFIVGNNGARFPKLRLGNLDAKRDWGFCRDYMEGVLKIAQYQEPDDFVLCTGETNSVSDFLDAAFGAVNISDWSQYVVQDPKFMRPREVEFLLGSSRKAEDVLGWTPTTSFNELVEMMVHDQERTGLGLATGDGHSDVATT